MSKRPSGSRPLRMVCVDARPNSFYGAQRSLCTLVANLDACRIRPIVLTTADGDLARGFRSAGADVRILPAGSVLNVFGGGVFRYPFRHKLLLGAALARFWARFLVFLVRERIDLVYANDLRSLLLAGPVARLLRRPVIWYVRETHRVGRLQAVGARLADRIILIADDVIAAFTAEERSRFARKFVTVRTGFDLPASRFDPDLRARRRAELGIPQDAPVIGLVGSIHPRKGHDVLVEAAPAILEAHPDVRFLVVGAAPAEQADFERQLRSRAEELGVASAFVWAGYASDASSSYAAMDVLVLPSRMEGLPRVVIEGLGFGLPVVATDVGGTREILVEPWLGILLSELSPGALSSALVGVLRWGSGDAMRRAEFVERHFSVASYVGCFTRVAESLLR